MLKVSGEGLTIGEAQIEIPAHTLLNIADKPIPVTGEAISCEAPVPADMKASVKACVACPCCAIG